MIGVNVLAVAAAAAYLGACLGLYLPLPGSHSRTAGWLSALFLMLLAAPWLDRPGLGIIRIFLMGGFLFHFCAWNLARGRAHLHRLAASLFLCACAATRIEFLCLLLPFLFLSVSGWAFTRAAVFRKGVQVAGAALVIGLPWQAFAFAGPGDESPARNFYTLTLPEVDWLGDAVPLEMASVRPEIFPSESGFLSRLAAHSGDGGMGLELEREVALWREGWRNVKAHPGKFVRNWRANCNRMAFDFPYSRIAGRPAARMAGRSAAIGTGNRALVTSALLLLSTLCLYPWWRARKSLPGEALLVSAWAVAGLAARSFLSSGADALLVWAPCLLLVIGLTFTTVLRPRIRSAAVTPGTFSISTSTSTSASGPM